MVFTQYNDLMKDSCQGTNWAFVTWQKIVSFPIFSIASLNFDDSWENFGCWRNSFALEVWLPVDKFFLHNKQFCLVQTGPKHLTITLQIRLGGFILLVVWYTVFSTQQPPLIRKEQTGHYEERTEQKWVSTRINNRGHCEEKAIVKGVRGIGRSSTAQALLDVIYTSPIVSVRSPRHFFFSSFPIFFVIIVWQVKQNK